MDFLVSNLILRKLGEKINDSDNKVQGLKYINHKINSILYGVFNGTEQKIKAKLDISKSVGVISSDNNLNLEKIISSNQVKFYYHLIPK